MDIFDMLQAPNIATYYVTAASNNIPFLGATLFPSQKRLGLDLSWIKGSNGLPVALAPAEFDTKAPIRDRIGVSKIETEMPFFREAMRVGEKERQEILKAQGAANSALIMPIINKIYADATNLVNGSDVQLERMRCQLLYSGKITIVANGLQYKYDYKMKASHKVTPAVKWSDTANATPIDDIMEWQDQVEDDTGNRPTRAICTRKTWNYLKKNLSIKKDMNVQNGQNIIMTDSSLQDYLSDKVSLTVSVYNKKFLDKVGGNSENFFIDDVFTMIPDGTLGTSYYGTTPEEADLMSGKSRAQVQVVNTGIAVTTYLEEHPVNSMTIVSAIMLPSFESIDSVVIATVN